MLICEICLVVKFFFIIVYQQLKPAQKQHTHPRPFHSFIADSDLLPFLLPRVIGRKIPPFHFVVAAVHLAASALFSQTSFIFSSGKLAKTNWVQFHWRIPT